MDSSFAHLRSRSSFSFLDCPTPPGRLAGWAAREGVKSLALTDDENICGVFEFFEACKAEGVKPVLGVTLEGKLSALVKDERGYSNLCRLVSRRHLKDGFDLAREAVACSEGLVFLVPDPALLERLARGLFPASLRAEVVRPGSVLRERELLKVANASGVKAVASNDPRFLRPGEFSLHALLECIREGRPPFDAKDAHEDRFLRTPREMEELFRDLPEAVRENARVANACEFDPSTLPVTFPRVELPPGETAVGRLRRLAESGARKRYARVAGEVRARMDRELRVITKLGFADYFLVVEEIVRHARSLGTPVAGRGSGAGSLVSYVLFITDVDPVRYGLSFERFLNSSRTDYPDLDVDFCWRLRDSVIEHVFKEYGDAHVAMVSTIARFRSALALKELVRIMGEEEARALPDLGRLIRELTGLPHHVSVHCGGVVITPGPIEERAPCMRARKGVVIMQFDKDACERAGLVKLDLLGNRGLSTVSETLRATSLTEEDIPDEDPRAMALVREGRTLGCVQLESPAMRRLLVMLRPRDLKGVMKALALIRPGAASLGMKKRFVLRERGLEAVPNDFPFLRESNGVMLYEDDVLRAAVALAGASVEEADTFRRRVKRCRTDEERRELSREFLSRCEAHGTDPRAAAELWVQMAKFNEYSFCKAHAASYARIAYAAAFLKSRFPREFLVAALNNNAGMYPKRVYVEEAKRHGVPVLLPDVNRSREVFALEEGGIRVGLGMVKGLSGSAMKRMIQERAQRPFDSLLDFLSRARPAFPEAESLALCGALDFTRVPRPALLCELYTRRKGRVPRAVELPDYDELQKAREEWRVLGLCVREHPAAVARASCPGAVFSSKMPRLVGRRVEFIGILDAVRVLERMTFLTFEDESGVFEVTRLGRFIPGGVGPYIIRGRVEDELGALSVRAERIDPLPRRRPAAVSRDSSLTVSVQPP